MSNDNDLFTIGTAEEFEQLKADSGVGITRIHFGDYTFEIAEAVLQAAKSTEKPHNMTKVTARVIESALAENKMEIGNQITTFYAGSPQSPAYMKKRMKALCAALGISPNKQGGLKIAQFIGKRFDASIVWELQESDKLDEMGNAKMYVNDRLKAERKVGEERPKGFNPVAESARAEKHLIGRGFPTGSGGGTAEGDAPPWGEGETAAGGAGAGGEQQGFIDEADVDEKGHEYRAIVKLGGDEADSARQALVDAGIDPDGPIDVNRLEGDVKKAYEAKFMPRPALPKLGKPPLANAPNGGVRRPALR